jgi:hypothetical protein
MTAILAATFILSPVTARFDAEGQIHEAASRSVRMLSGGTDQEHLAERGYQKC